MCRLICYCDNDDAVEQSSCEIFNKPILLLVRILLELNFSLVSSIDCFKHYLVLVLLLRSYHYRLKLYTKVRKDHFEQGDEPLEMIDRPSSIRMSCELMYFCIDSCLNREISINSGEERSVVLHWHNETGTFA